VVHESGVTFFGAGAGVGFCAAVGAAEAASVTHAKIKDSLILRSPGYLVLSRMTASNAQGLPSKAAIRFYPLAVSEL
jgi:hypothetical protein